MNYLDKFYESLEKEGLKYKTINKHYNNVHFFVETFLKEYYEVDAIEGMKYVEDFLGDWFIRKAMWSTESTIKSNITSFKKFYKLLMTEGDITEGEYKFFTRVLKENKDEWIDRVNEYNDPYSSNPFAFDFDFDFDPESDD